MQGQAVEENDFSPKSIATPWFNPGIRARDRDHSAQQEDMMARKNHAVDRHLGARVRFARIEKRISQGALGEQLGISFQQVQKYELGKDRISASQLMNIARILEKDISFFFEDITPEGETSGGMELADIVDRRKRSRASATYDVKIIRILHSIEDERVKLKLYNLMEAIVASKAPVEAEPPVAPAAPAAEDVPSLVQ
jgi:transcriptional regulator with XRE-family HTH domain